MSYEIKAQKTIDGYNGEQIAKTLRAYSCDGMIFLRSSISALSSYTIILSDSGDLIFLQQNGCYMTPICVFLYSDDQALVEELVDNCELDDDDDY